MTTQNNLVNVSSRSLLLTRAALRAISSIAKCRLDYQEKKGAMAYTVSVFGTGKEKDTLLWEFAELEGEFGLYSFLVKRAYNQILANALQLEKVVTASKGRTIRTSGTAAKLNDEFNVLGEYAKIFGLNHDGSPIAPTQDDAQDDAQDA